ncbi:YfiR/HmsC family protein [Arenibaculum pallidiluteum]|uniref:YfiR/HmsC family protein n=1 Tax=Arenibaculum pallidiluteum TaxID=2812559 RepID=UPI001A964BB7|nr:YfiR/HmsC family protein [Arenibaculum pallidiluteum]
MQKAAVLLLALGALVSAPAWADVGAKDVQVIAKTVGFTTPPLTGQVKVAVVFDAAAAASQKDAEALKGILGAGLAAGAATLVPVMVPVDQVEAGLDGAAIAFVTTGLSAHYDKVFAAAKAKKVLSVSTDAACVQAGRCVMGVKSEPKVEILVNKAAAEASSVAFAPAFRMMISEI